MKPLVVYDQKDHKRLAYLQNAYAINYKQETNALWTADFKLPYSDTKNTYCQPFNYIEIWDLDGYGKDKYVGLFRIIEIEEDSILNETSYILEHVFGTLLDSYVIDARTYGDWHLELAETVDETIAKILEWQDVDNPDKRKWVLDQCSYKYRVSLTLNYQSILDSLYALTDKLTNDNHYWRFNTLSYPWELNLIRVNKEQPIVTDIRYKKNMVGIVKRTDIKNMANKLYVYGKQKESGHRVNFGIINDGKEYISFPESIAKYGTIIEVMFQESLKYERDLLEYAEEVFEKIKYPFVTYEIDVRTFQNAGMLKLGDKVRVIGPTGLDEELIVQQIIREDITRSPNNGKIILGTGTVNIGVILKGRL